MSKILIFFIRMYQETLSPIIGKNCRFTPSCSQYAIDAINEYGAAKGVVMGIRRILKCNPFCKGGFDPVRKKND